MKSTRRSNSSRRPRPRPPSLGKTSERSDLPGYKILAYRQCLKHLWLEILPPDLRDDLAYETVFVPPASRGALPKPGPPSVFAETSMESRTSERFFPVGCVPIILRRAGGLASMAGLWRDGFLPAKMTDTLTSAIPAVCPELGIEVPVSSIDRELRKLWEQDAAQTNASLMNLVVYSEKPGALIANSEIIRDLTREHACRAILVEIDSNEPTAGLRAWITAHCHLADGRKSVCCEQIAFYLTGRVTGRFRNTVFSHLNSDLPLVFWWQGELSDILTERLVSVVDRFIIDSSAWENPAASFARIEETAQSNSELVIQDHAWTRSWQFRVGIAGLFDDPVAQEALPEINGVEIVYHPAHRNTALQVLAWLAVQAGWKDRETKDRFAFTSGAGVEISVTLTEDTAAPPLGSVIIRAHHTTVRVTQKAGASHVERQVMTDAYKAVSLSPIDPTTPAELVAVQLARGGKNSLYQKILPRFRAMLES